MFLYALVWFVLVFAEATFAGLRCGFVTDFVGVGCCVVFVGFVGALGLTCGFSGCCASGFGGLGAAFGLV